MLAARFCETPRRVTVIAGHAPFSSPPRARFCPAYDPRSACGAAARASRRANAGIRHTPPFSPIAAWRIPPAGGQFSDAQLVKGFLRRFVQKDVALMLRKKLF